MIKTNFYTMVATLKISTENLGLKSLRNRLKVFPLNRGIEGVSHSSSLTSPPPKQGDRGGLLIALKKRVQMYDIIPEVWAWGTINLTFLHIFPCRTQGVPEKCVTLQRKHSLLRASLGARRPYPPRCKDPRRYFCRNNVRGS